ncbi:type II toxin-antitoxin system VapC family toxin [Luedemannella helvata]|uniref:Ribonuclease VapC n=1 Tax=Luedemannella helvata TaxID=349315 RepID=A0ABP4XE21_9ACTN
MSFVVLDTDVASAALRGRLPDQFRARLAGQTVCITFVTLGELTKWTHLRSWGPRRLAGLREWRSDVVLLPYNEAVSLVWGELQARAQHRGRPRPVNDTWIAACCLAHGLPLATFNVKDYEDFVAHDGLHLVDAGPGPVRP